MREPVASPRKEKLSNMEALLQQIGNEVDPSVEDHRNDSLMSRLEHVCQLRVHLYRN